MKRWLTARPRTATIDQLQHLLDASLTVREKIR
jgi:hypothetical protein